MVAGLPEFARFVVLCWLLGGTALWALIAYLSNPEKPLSINPVTRAILNAIECTVMLVLLVIGGFFR